jgi:hypothetical protein
VEHLFLATHAENMADKANKGRAYNGTQLRGEMETDDLEEEIASRLNLFQDANSTDFFAIVGSR